MFTMKTTQIHKLGQELEKLYEKMEELEESMECEDYDDSAELMAIRRLVSQMQEMYDYWDDGRAL